MGPVNEGARHSQDSTRAKDAAMPKLEEMVQVIEERFGGILRRADASPEASPAPILLEDFLTAYEAIVPLLRLFGRPFYFVEMDVVKKIKQIRESQKVSSPVLEDMFGVIQSQIDEGISRDGKCSARHILRLNRALKFVYLFFEAVDQHAEPRPAAEQAYKQSLAAHQGWAIRKTVELAFYTLPSHADLAKANEGSALEGLFKPSTALIERVYKILDDFYTERGIQDLP